MFSNRYRVDLGTFQWRRQYFIIGVGEGEIKKSKKKNTQELSMLINFIAIAIAWT